MWKETVKKQLSNRLEEKSTFLQEINLCKLCLIVRAKSNFMPMRIPSKTVVLKSQYDQYNRAATYSQKLHSISQVIQLFKFSQKYNFILLIDNQFHEFLSVTNFLVKYNFIFRSKINFTGFKVTNFLIKI